MTGDLEKREDCKPCTRKQRRVDQRRNSGLFIGILLALLPKCPFCFVAYSSTIMLCGKGGSFISVHNSNSLPAIIFSALLCLIALLCIIFNYRGRRTKYAMILSGIGTGLIMMSVITGGGFMTYYPGVFLVFTGVWLNGSLLYFVKKAKDMFSRITAEDFSALKKDKFLN